MLFDSELRAELLPHPSQPSPEVKTVNRPLTLPNARPFFGMLLLALLTATLLPQTSWSQASDASVNAEARTQFGEQLDTAKALVEAGDAESLVQAGETFLQAAETANNSGDAELAERTKNAQENALKAFMDAGTAYSGAKNHEASAAQFMRTAEVATLLGNTELQAKALSNATVPYLRAKDVENALSSIDQAIDLAPNNLNYAYTRGVVLRSKGDLEGATSAFADLESNATEAGNEAMVARARENIGKTHLLAARATLRAKEYQQTISALDEAAPFLGEDNATLQTYYANAYYQLGVKQVKAEQWNTAERTLGKARNHAQKADNAKIVQGAQEQLDYIKKVKASQQ